MSKNHGMPVQYGYSDDIKYPLIGDIRLVTQLANATAADFRQKSADVIIVYAEVGSKPLLSDTCTETINAHAYA